MNENSPADRHYNVDLVQGNTNGKLISGKGTAKAATNNTVSGSQARKMQNSRLDVMKKQFNKKVNRRGMPMPQKIVASAASGRLNPNSYSASNVNNLYKIKFVFD